MVLSGSRTAVERAVAMAPERGIKRAVMLAVSAPFHCALMQPAAVAMREALRFEGKMIAASVSRTADRWFIAFEVDVPDAQFHRKRTGHGAVGAEIGRAHV